MRRLFGGAVSLVMCVTACAPGDDGFSNGGNGLPPFTVGPTALSTPQAPPSPGSPSDDEAVFEQFRTWVADALNDISGHVQPLDCPPDPPFPIYQVTLLVEQGSTQPSLDWCASPVLEVDPHNPAARVQALKMKNTAPVPIRIGLTAFDGVLVHLPGEVFTIPLPGNLVPGDSIELTYRIDADGIAYTVLNELANNYARPPLPGFISLAACASAPDAACVLSNLSSILPDRIELLGRSIPLATIASALGTMLHYQPLIAQWTGLEAGHASGTIAIAYFGTG